MIRQIRPSDIHQVLEIERQTFDQPWSKDDFRDQLRQQNISSVLIENRDDKTLIDGYCVYATYPSCIEILNMASHPDCRREGVCADLVLHLINKLGGKLKSVQLIVRETNLACQLFLKSLGFMATEVIRSPFDDCDEDAYRFEFRQAKLERVRS